MRGVQRDFASQVENSNLVRSGLVPKHSTNGQMVPANLVAPYVPTPRQRDRMLKGALQLEKLEGLVGLG